MSLNSTTRFFGRASYYIRARPKYPPAFLQFLQTDLGLLPTHRVADIGSGTGILSELFLNNGNPIMGVEPNAEMRSAGEELLSGYPNFHSVTGTAENTTLADRSADFVVAGQAFHWFEPAKAREEFLRILAPGGWVVLVWNERVKNGSGFDAAYDGIVRDFAAGTEVDFHTTVTGAGDGVLGPFFGPGGFQTREFANSQALSLEDVKARVLSSSYMPLTGHPSFPAMISRIEREFAAHQVNGSVHLAYDTRAYYGKLI